MCGIIGYVGPKKVQPLLLHGLQRLEYRGYDSAGVALLEPDGLHYTRAVGNLSNLKQAASSNGNSRATTGLGHTRWATHGAVTERNAHPLTGCDDGALSIVLNGIVENYRELKAGLEADGHEFTTETDAETVAHLIERHYEGDLLEAARRALGDMEGHFSFVVIHANHPDELVGARFQTPLVVGLGDGENFVASNAAAFLKETRRVMFPDDHQLVSITPGGVRFIALDGSPVEHDELELDWDDEDAEKGGYETFMLKEIYEQPEAVAETIGDRLRHGKLALEGLGLSDEELRQLRRIVILACGTTYHAGVVGRLRARGVGADPRRAGHRERVDLPRSGDRRGHARDRRLPVGGDPRHGQRDEARPRARRATLAIADMMGSRIPREVDSVLSRAAASRSASPRRTFTARSRSSS